MSAATIQRRRHVHSPRMRKLARDAGVDLDAVRGSGPSGRVVREDILRAASTQDAAAGPDHVAPPAAVAAGAFGVVVGEVDVTHLRALASRAGLIAVIAAETMRALRRQGAATTDVGESLDVDGILVEHAADLTVPAMLRRIAEGGRATSSPDDAPRVAIKSRAGDGLLLHLHPLDADRLLTVGVGAVVERPVVACLPDREHVIAVAALANVSVTYDPARISAAVAETVLGQVIAGVREPAAARGLAD
ncbi:MAG: hypothetical protein JWO57_1320 [Pseudonocardiales bacterium]|nr:hypothetical protein [Pseudonocardiales bacterium]